MCRLGEMIREVVTSSGRRRAFDQSRLNTKYNSCFHRNSSVQYRLTYTDYAARLDTTPSWDNGTGHDAIRDSRGHLDSEDGKGIIRNSGLLYLFGPPCIRLDGIAKPSQRSDSLP